MWLKILLLAVLSLMCLMSSTFSQTMPPLEPGVSQKLAEWRAANYSGVRYKLNITLEKGAPLMKGEIEIRVNLTEAGQQNDLILDWRTTQFQNDKDKPFAEVIKVNESVVKETPRNGVFDYTIDKEHLIVSKKYLKTGENVLQIKFASPIKTSGAAVTRYVDKEDGAEYIYSLFVPSDASTAFPCFDQPDLKAKFTLEVDAPKDWKIITNDFKLISTFSVSPGNPNPKQIPEGFIRHIFFETLRPISTYVFAFAAGEFERFTDVPECLKIFDSNERDKYQRTRECLNSSTVYVRKSQAEKFKPHAAEVFRLNREAVKFLEGYFDYKFPFPKYDLVLIPEFPFGGMEHAGATFLRESAVIFPTEPTKNDYVSRATLIFHETAHQWFGDTVTMKWFDDLWLKEGFATFMGFKALEKIMPEYNAWKIFYERTKQAAYLTDSTKGTTPIYQEIPNLSAAKSAYGAIVYSKAPSFLKQAEFYLGEKEFQTAVRAFLKKHEFSNAGWQDLVSEFEASSKQDLKDWANVWVKQKSLPKIVLSRSGINVDGESFSEYNTQYYFEQSDTLETKAMWKQCFNTLLFFNNGITENIKINLAEQSRKNPFFTFAERTLGGIKTTINGKKSRQKEEPLAVFPNYQDYGYGIFLLDEKSRDYVLQNIQNEKDDFLRSMMWGSLWDSVREGELNPRDYVELVIKNLNVETDESTIATLLGRVSTAMNYYLSEPSALAGGLNQTDSKPKTDPSANADGSDKASLVSKLENLLIEKMQNAPTVGQKITFYRAFLNIANSERARNVLKDLLRPKTKDQRPFELKTKDKFDIVTKLLILGDKDAPNLLAELEKTEASDDAKRYAYAAKAGMGTADNKAKFWNDFVNNKEISESWIEAAFASFNSIKHSELTLPYLEKALAELPNHKRSRKIFFVNGWLAAFIGGQKSEQALQIVNQFLADNPNLDKDLRLKILEVSDGLERAVKIRKKYQ